ncbi:coiled-coil domain-containing protein [Aeromonas veronii]
MSSNKKINMKIDNIFFIGEGKKSSIPFFTGVNVVCGASDTGKSFLAETIDYMFGGSALDHVPELIGYQTIEMNLSANDSPYKLSRSIHGGAFGVLKSGSEKRATLKAKGKAEDKNTISYFLLNLINLTGKKILKSTSKSTLVNLSFRDLARLIIVQEDEIQKKLTPFWNGQYVTKTSNLATVKLLLTGADDSGIITPDLKSKVDNTQPIELINEIIEEIKGSYLEPHLSLEELTQQLERLDANITACRQQLNQKKSSLKEQLELQRSIVAKRTEIDNRRLEIKELLSRFALLKEHYITDLSRLRAIEESGYLLSQLDSIACPVCGSDDSDYRDCDNIEMVVHAASSEVHKTLSLKRELSITIFELDSELHDLGMEIKDLDEKLESIDLNIKGELNPLIITQEGDFTNLLETQFSIRTKIDAYEQIEFLEIKKSTLSKVDITTATIEKVKQGLPDEQIHNLALIISKILREWGFPGQCLVHFDKTSYDFIIDGKSRSRMGKGLRAITHSAITIGLLEFCQINNMPHPGIVVLDSPLLAYFEPEEDDDIALSHTNLKDKFYTYLLKNHSRESQIIIIENQAPPKNIHELMHVTVFTRNTSKGRYGLLI